MIYDILVDFINIVVYLLKGLPKSLDFLKPYATLLGVIVLLMRQNNIKKMVNSHLPKKYRDTQSNDIYDMKKDIRAIKQHLGVVECGDIKTSSNTEAKNSKRLRTIFSKVTLLRKLLSRRNQRMKTYLKKLGSRKFQSFVVGFGTQLFILLKFDEGLYTNEIASAGLIITTIVYIWVEGSSDKASIKKGARELEPDYTQSDSVSE